MSLFKCKMCGGSLEIAAGTTVIECEYCGTQQTLPKLDDDKRANMYDRANHFRRNNEFDKAMGIYEQILNEDNTDAEAYWSIVLCRYGIEYVEDPSTKRRIPTVNRAQYTSILADEDYKSALANADTYQKSVYELEAKAIDEIQKGILAISQKEEPFDVFICYKETDNNGRRTPDSVLAQELYFGLKNEGFKVFFARITLEDKLGSAYEPYIFAALNSAKVMVVLGTKPEFFSAVWVKNEWSRYLALIKQGQKKMLIPAYKDMDPYDLPEDFSHLQAQDMSKLGFMQDLIRGIKKIVKADEPKQTVVKETVVKETVATTGASNTAPLLKRAFMFLEDGEFDRADVLCEQVLNQDPENAQAYVAKLMIELSVKKQDSLKDCTEPFDDKNNYQKAIRFGDDKLKATLNGYTDYINTRNENARLEEIYINAISEMESATTEDAYYAIAEVFKSISHYKDSAILAEKCIKESDEADTKGAYLDAKNSIVLYQEFGKLSYLETAVDILRELGDYKDSASLLSEYEITLEKEKEKEKEKVEIRAKRIKTISMIVLPILVTILACIIIFNTVIIPIEKYNDALALMKAEKYTEAILAFKSLNGYKDSETKISECNTAILDNRYNNAIELMDAGNIVEAYEALTALKGYKDSAEKAASIHFEYKVKKLKSAKVGDYVFLGAYEQDGDTSNGKESVEWLVLESRDDKLLVISKHALDRQPYNTTYTSVTWEKCTLRNWLNNDFVNTAFSADEKAMIPMVTVSADKNLEYDIPAGNATQDQVFLLSITEANKYFRADSARQCKPTDYAVANGANIENGNCIWWLRSPGVNQSNAAFVSINGPVQESGHSVRYEYISVRPAMWIDLNSIQEN